VTGAAPGLDFSCVSPEAAAAPASDRLAVAAAAGGLDTLVASTSPNDPLALFAAAMRVGIAVA
jgi:hypothetical protein